MCDLCRVETDQSIEVKGRSAELKIENNRNSVRQHLADQAMLEVPQIMDVDACHAKAFDEMRSDSFDLLAPLGAGPE